MRSQTLVAFVVLFAATAFADEPLPPIPPIPRLLPPEGVKLPEEERKTLEARLEEITSRLRKLTKQFESLSRTDDGGPYNKLYLASVAVFPKAVRFAIDFDEFYDVKKDVAKAHKQLDEAETRLKSLETGDFPPPWVTASRLVVLGYESFDGPQPYGVVFPKDFGKSDKIYPIYAWLHGRGDKSTDLHFIHERMTQLGQLGDVDAIVVHPFGRQCVGFKSAGEIDVVMAPVHFRFLAQLSDPLTPEQVPLVLMGFSMGGAGAWHIGAHRPYEFVAVAPGAGFAETAQYTKTDPVSVPWYERKLWGLYDVPCYTRNFFNTEVIAYSSENDKQIQAARVMEEAFRAEGRELTHLIGPGVEHKYEPETLAELKARLAKITSKYSDGEPPTPESSEEHLQTRTLRYARTGKVEAFGLQRHWEDSRIDGKHTLEGEAGMKTLQLKIDTKNISAWQLKPRGRYGSVIVDGQKFDFSEDERKRHFLRFEKFGDKWDFVLNFKPGLHKRPGMQGPIDDAFMEPCLIVAPTGKSKNPLVERWVQFELRHTIDRWRALMRGTLPMKNDDEITNDDIQRFNLVCFGDPDSNAIIRRVAMKLPISWRDDRIMAGERHWPTENHIPALIYPSPLWNEELESHTYRDGESYVRGDRKYLVINSGLTFREAHDKTNSQQNPKLPDWAVIDLTQLPDDKAPGRIAAAGFFDEQWKWQENTE